MKQNLFEIAVGFVVLFTSIFFLIFSYGSQNHESTSTYSISATFQNVDGIIKGSDINIAGIPVGKVESLKLDRTTYNAVLKFSIDSKVKIPTDSRASVTTSGFLGGKFISITPGGDEGYISDGGEIKYTQSSVNLENLIGKFMYSSKGE